MRPFRGLVACCGWERKRNAYSAPPASSLHRFHEIIVHFLGLEDRHLEGHVLKFGVWSLDPVHTCVSKLRPAIHAGILTLPSSLRPLSRQPKQQVFQDSQGCLWHVTHAEKQQALSRTRPSLSRSFLRRISCSSCKAFLNSATYRTVDR